MGYTLGQFRAYQAAAAAVQNEKAALLLNLIYVGTQGAGKNVEKLVKALGG
jgi:hypothetical protein